MQAMMLKKQDFLTTCDIPEKYSCIALRAVYRKDQYLGAALSKMMDLL